MPERGRLKLVADVALLSRDRVLLVKYRDTQKYDGQTGWFLPDDSLRRLEHPKDAVLRILREQVGVSLPGLELHFIESLEGNGGMASGLPLWWKPSRRCPAPTGA